MRVNEFQSIEERHLDDYITESVDELEYSLWLSRQRTLPSLIIAEGFEERSLGIVEKLAAAGARVSDAILGRYVRNPDMNRTYRPRFEAALEIICPNRWRVVDNHNDGKWVAECLTVLSGSNVLLDITALSNRGLFEAIDSLSTCGKAVHLGYSEAFQYWPKKEVWDRIRKRSSDDASLSDIVDKEPWLFGYEHCVQLVPGHEGYDSAGSGRALIAFLPYKRARLAAILGAWEYEDMLFIAGRPRQEHNSWRLDALQEINAPVTKSWPVEQMSTFGYRDALRQFSRILFSESSLLCRYDVHMAILGSKIQNVACWAVSCILPSLTIVTSVPEKYYTEAFSEGIGTSWVIDLRRP